MTAARICPIAEAADYAALHQDPGAVSVPGVRQRAGASAPVCTTLTIPAPPSVNKLFKSLMPRGGKPGGRAKTKDYKDWLKEAGWMVREQLACVGCDPIAGRVVVTISVERESLLADIDNRCKAILDLLVESKAIEDDRWVVGLAACWAPRGNARVPRARIAIMPATAHTLDFHPSPDGATGGWFINAPGEEPDGD